MKNLPIITEWLPDGSLNRGRLESEIRAQIRLSYNYWKLVFETETPTLPPVVIAYKTLQLGYFTDGKLFFRATIRYLKEYKNVLHFEKS